MYRQSHGRRLFECVWLAQCIYSAWYVDKSPMALISTFTHCFGTQDGLLKTYGSKYTPVDSHIQTLRNFCSFGNLAKKDDGTYELPVPCYSPTSVQGICWAEKDVGQSVLALFKNYQERKDEIWGKTFYVGTAHITYPDFAAILSEGPSF